MQLDSSKLRQTRLIEETEEIKPTIQVMLEDDSKTLQQIA